MQKINKGQTVTITCQGMTVTGKVEYIDHEYKYSVNKPPEIVGYIMEVRSNTTHKVHYWKSLQDGGTITVERNQ